MRDMTDHDDPISDPKNVLLIEVALDRDCITAHDNFHRAEKFAELTADDFTRFAPNVVICPLFKPRFDAIDVGTMMLGHTPGALLLVDCPALPRPRMVLNEITKACPALRIDLFDRAKWINPRLIVA